jgi:hypothetical protein
MYSHLEGDVSIGEIWWFWRGGQDDFLSKALSAMFAAGLSADNPVSGRRFVLDGEGRQIPWNNEDVQQRWMAGNVVVLQLWVSQDADVLLTAERPQNLLTVDLGGMTLAEARRTLFATLDAALKCAETLAVVADRELPERGDDLVAWKNQASPAQPPFEPDLVMRAHGGGHFTLDVRPGSWLAGDHDSV